MKNIFYFQHINAIGGIETFFYNLAQKYSKWDITIYYRTGDINQINRLAKLVRVKQYQDGEIIECDKAFFNFNLDIINNVKAKEYIQIAHGDYKAMGIQPNISDKITKYLGVSEQVCRTYEEITGYKTQLVYNPIVVDKPKRVLHLLSATRLTKEKGRERIEKMIRALDDAKIPWEWHIYTDDTDKILHDNVVYRRPSYNIIDYIADADYLVQLSDNEGYCYSVVEALTVGTPVIVTECPVFYELGVETGKNGFVLPFSMQNIPVMEIYESDLKFEYTPKKDTWNKHLARGKSTYTKEQETIVRVKITRPYFDIPMQRTVSDGEILTVSKPRAEMLITYNVATLA